MQTAEWFALLAVFMGSTAQSITGIGFALICAPLLIVCLGPLDGVTLVNILGLSLSTFVVVRERRFLSIPFALALLLPAVVVAPVGKWLIHSAGPSLLSVVSGCLVLVGVALLLADIRSKRLDSKSGAIAAGAVGGLMGVIAGIAGPAVALYATNAKWDHKTMRPTLNFFFIAVGVIAVVVRGLPSVHALFGVTLFASVGVGILAGHLIAKRLHVDFIHKLVLALAAIGGLAAVANGLS